MQTQSVQLRCNRRIKPACLIMTGLKMNRLSQTPRGARFAPTTADDPAFAPTTPIEAETSPSGSQSVTAHWDPQYLCDLVVVYEGTTTRHRALQLCGHLAQQLQGEYDFRCSWWNLDQFNNPGLCEQAADAAAKADMVMVSLRDDERLTAAIDRWLKGWLSRRSDQQSALVALLEEEGQPSLCPSGGEGARRAGEGVGGFLGHGRRAGQLGTRCLSYTGARTSAAARRLFCFSPQGPWTDQRAWEYPSPSTTSRSCALKSASRSRFRIQTCIRRKPDVDLN